MKKICQRFLPEIVYLGVFGPIFLFCSVILLLGLMEKTKINLYFFSMGSIGSLTLCLTAVASLVFGKKDGPS